MLDQKEAKLDAPNPHACSAQTGTNKTQLDVGAGFGTDARESMTTDSEAVVVEPRGVSVFQEVDGPSGGGCTSIIPVGEHTGIRVGTNRPCDAHAKVETNIVNVLSAGASDATRDSDVHESHTACELLGSPTVPDTEVVAEPGTSGAECSLMMSTPPTTELYTSLSMTYDDAWPDVTQDPDLGTADSVGGHDVVYTTLTGTCEGRVRFDAPSRPGVSHEWLVATLRSQDCERLKNLMPDVVARWQSPAPEGVDLAPLLEVR